MLENPEDLSVFLLSLALSPGEPPAADPAAALKIAVVVLLCSALGGTVTGFLDGRRSGWRAFALLLALGATLGTLQVIRF